MDLQLEVALIAAGSALLGSLVGGVSSRLSTAYAQGHQDRREKRQRVHASFQRVLTAANILAARLPRCSVDLAEPRRPNNT